MPLSTFLYTDDVDDVMAAHMNRVTASTLRGELGEAVSITTETALTDGDFPYLQLTPNADLDVLLAPEASTNHLQVIENGSGTYYLSVKDDSDTTLIHVVGPYETAVFVPSLGSGWKVVKPTALNGSSVLSAAYSIAAAAGTYADTGLSVTLPAAGTYLITADVRATMLPNTGTGWYIVAKLYNSTDAADVTNSERMVARENAAVLLDVSSTINVIVTVTASKVIKLYAKRDGSGTPTFTTSDISSDGSGRTAMMFTKIG